MSTKWFQSAHFVSSPNHGNVVWHMRLVDNLHKDESSYGFYKALLFLKVDYFWQLFLSSITLLLSISTHPHLIVIIVIYVSTLHGCTQVPARLSMGLFPSS